MEIEFAAVYDPAGVNSIVNCTSSGVLSDTIWIKKVNNDIYYPGGRVGIGTINPNELLSVESTAPNVNIASFRNPAGWGQISVFTGDSTSVLASVNGSGTIIGSNSNHRLQLRSNSVEHVTLLPNGNLGVGTATPQTSLDVSGHIRIGDSGVACTATNLGALRRDGTNTISQCVLVSPGVYDWRLFGGVQFITCRKSIPYIGLGDTKHAFTVAECGGVLPDATYKGFIRIFRQCGIHHNLSIYNTGEAIPASFTGVPATGPGISFWTDNPCQLSGVSLCGIPGFCKGYVVAEYMR
jgi:hypothetical protein